MTDSRYTASRLVKRVGKETIIEKLAPLCKRISKNNTRCWQHNFLIVSALGVNVAYENGQDETYSLQICKTVVNFIVIEKHVSL